MAVTAMPVVNAKARTITTKIVFMTLALWKAMQPSMPEPAKRSVTGITERAFSPPVGARTSGERAF
jgi:hypothetical protein